MKQQITFEQYLAAHPYRETRSFTKDDWKAAMFEHWQEDCATPSPLPDQPTKKFNTDTHLWEIRNSAGEIIAYLPQCMPGEYGKYETSFYLDAIAGLAPSVFPATPPTPGNERPTGEGWQLDDSTTGVNLWQDSKRDEGICLATIYTEAPNWKEVANLIQSAPAMAKILKRVKFIFGNENNYRQGTIGYELAKECEAILNNINNQ